MLRDIATNKLLANYIDQQGNNLLQSTVNKMENLCSTPDHSDWWISPEV